jgi:hypothetical protein
VLEKRPSRVEGLRKVLDWSSVGCRIGLDLRQQEGLGNCRGSRGGGRLKKLRDVRRLRMT